MADPIPMFDLSSEIDELWDELNGRIQDVLRSGRFILGPNVAALEREVAEFVGVRHAIGVNSGTDALVVGLRALGLGPGDEVITTPFSFFATAESVNAVGATPVFADVCPDTLNLDPEAVAAKIGPRTRALLPVHLFGQGAEMAPLLELAERHGLKVLEDNAQAFGSSQDGRKLGSLGHAGALSFFPAKSLGAFGDAGMIVTDDDEVAEQARMLRSHGSRKKYVNEVIGYNSRLDELQAAILRVRLPRLDNSNQRRNKVADLYRTRLGDVSGLTLPVERPGNVHVYNYYTVRIEGDRRDDVARRLGEAGVSTAIYYPTPLHHLPPYEGCGASCPVAERAADEVLSLPMGPAQPEADTIRIADSLRAALAG